MTDARYLTSTGDREEPKGEEGNPTQRKCSRICSLGGGKPFRQDPIILQNQGLRTARIGNYIYTEDREEKATRENTD